MNAVEVLVELVRYFDRDEFFRVNESCDYPATAVYIAFVPRLTDEQHGMYFASVPRVDIFRYGCAPDDATSRAVDLAGLSTSPIEETIWLVHELGHHMSNICGMSCPFDPTRPVLTYGEEVRAWVFGEEILQQTGFDSWSDFFEDKRTSLEGYREGLKLSVQIAVEIERLCDSWTARKRRCRPTGP